MTFTLAEAIGQRAREMRKGRGFTLDDLAGRMRLLGFRWTASRVVELEAGKVAPNLGTLWALATALADNGTVALRALLPEDGFVEIQREEQDVLNLTAWVAGGTDSSTAFGAGTSHRILKNFASAATSTLNELDRYSKSLGGRSLTLGEYSLLEEDKSLATIRAAQRLGIGPMELGVIAMNLWGRPFADERASRTRELGIDRQQRAIGWVTRRMVDQVRCFIEKDLTSNG